MGKAEEAREVKEYKMMIEKGIREYIWKAGGEEKGNKGRKVIKYEDVSRAVRNREELYFAEELMPYGIGEEEAMERAQKIKEMMKQNQKKKKREKKVTQNAEGTITLADNTE